jgi:hypothetical protein
MIHPISSTFKESPLAMFFKEGIGPFNTLDHDYMSLLARYIGCFCLQIPEHIS